MCDPCPVFFNVDLTDSNADGIPNECQCGDTLTGLVPGSNNGIHQAGDAFAIATCITMPAACGTIIALTDTDLSLTFQAADAFAVATIVVGGAPTFGPMCPFRPSGAMPIP